MKNINSFDIKNQILQVLENNIGKKLSVIYIYKELFTNEYYKLRTYDEKNYFDYLFLTVIRTLNNINKNIEINNNDYSIINYILLNKDQNNNVKLKNIYNSDDDTDDDTDNDESDDECSDKFDNKCNKNNEKNIYDTDTDTENKDNDDIDEVNDDNKSNTIDIDSLDEINSDIESFNNLQNEYVDNTHKYYFEINNFIEKQKNKNEKHIIDFVIDKELKEYYLLQDYKGNTIYHYLFFYNDVDRLNKIQENIVYTDLLVKNNANYQALDFIKHNSNIHKHIYRVLFKNIQQKDFLLNEVCKELSFIKPKINVLYNISNIINISIFIGLIYNKFF